MQPVRKSHVSRLAFVVGALALLSACGGSRFVKWFWPSPPPSMLQRSDGAEITGDDVKEAARDVATAIGDKAGELASRGYRRGRRWLEDALGEGDAEQEAGDKAVVGAERDGGGQAEASSDSDDGDAAEGVVLERPRLRDRFRINLSSFSEKQRGMLAVFYDFGLFGGAGALFLALAGWVRREDRRMVLAGLCLGFLSLAWAQMVMALSWLVFSTM